MSNLVHEQQPLIAMQLCEDGERFQFLCHICTEDPARFRKMMSQALTLDEYRAAVDKEMAK